MRILIIGTGAVGLAMAMTCCKSVKKVTSETMVVEAVTSEKLSTSDFARSFELEVYADTELKGFVPMLNPSIAEGDTIRIPTESGGMRQELIVTNKGIAHVTKSKPVARSSLSESTTAKETVASQTTSEKLAVSKEVTRHTWRFPWHLLVIVLVAIGLTLYRFDKQLLNPLTLFKWIRTKIPGSKS